MNSPQSTAEPFPDIQGYKVIEVLGKGGFGKVYKVGDLKLKRLVAAKSLRHSEVSLGSVFAEIKARFEREVVITASLNHPNIVTAYTTATDSENNFYLIMEFVPGGSLREYLDQRPTPALDLALKITADVCDALEVTQKQAIVHRDIKPHNIFLVKDERGDIVGAKLADFGVAMTKSETSATSSPTQRGAHPGTPLYMSPEQEFGKPFLDVRSDLFSLGLVLYEMVYGRAFKTTPDPWSDSSSPIDSVIKRLLKENLSERYATPMELKRDLMLIRGGKSISSADLPAVARQQPSSIASSTRTMRTTGGTAPLRRPSSQAQRRSSSIANILLIGGGALLLISTVMACVGVYVFRDSIFTSANGITSLTRATNVPQASVPQNTQGAIVSTTAPNAAATSAPASQPSLVSPQATATFTQVPQPTPSPTFSVKLPFSDSFNSGARQEWGKERGTWIMSGGGYTMTDLSDSPTYGVTTVGDIGWTNYLVKVKAFLPTSCGDNSLGVIVRAPNSQNYLVFVVSDRCDNGAAPHNLGYGTAAWFAVRDSKWTEISNTRYSNYITQSDVVPLQIEIKVIGDVITTLVNREQANSFSNLPFASGRVGLFLDARKSKRTASFDDFSVEVIAP